MCQSYGYTYTVSADLTQKYSMYTSLLYETAVQGDFFFDAQAMQQGLDQGDHDHLDGMVEHLELGSPPLSEVQASGYAATSHPPPAPEDSVKDGKQQ